MSVSFDPINPSFFLFRIGSQLLGANIDEDSKFPLQVQRKFCATFDTRMKDAPSKKTILQLVKKFETQLGVHSAAKA